LLLPGIVSWAGPLIDAPEIITSIKNSGLMLCTYGADNNNTASVDLQKRFGVDTVIVDHVAHIAGYLQDSKPKTKWQLFS